MKSLMLRSGILAALAIAVLALQLYEAPAAQAGEPMCTSDCVSEIQMCSQEAQQCGGDCFKSWLQCLNTAGGQRDQCLAAATTPAQEAQCEAEYDAAANDCDNDENVCSTRCINACFNCPSRICTQSCGFPIC